MISEYGRTKRCYTFVGQGNVSTKSNDKYGSLVLIECQSATSFHDTGLAEGIWFLLASSEEVAEEETTMASLPIFSMRIR